MGSRWQRHIVDSSGISNREDLLVGRTTLIKNVEVFIGDQPFFSVVEKVGKERKGGSDALALFIFGNFSDGLDEGIGGYASTPDKESEGN